MICGHIGCGRYNDAHAYHHYMETNHLYALELETQRVWDYAGDGYVHRLIQNTIDGKLVELPGATSDDNQRVPQVRSLTRFKFVINYVLMKRCWVVPGKAGCRVIGIHIPPHISTRVATHVL